MERVVEMRYGFFRSVVVVVFQSVFYLKMHQIICFYFLKNIFEINILK